MINVTKTYLPPIDEYIIHLREIWERSWVTNHGPIVQELEKKLKEYLEIKNIQFVSNGTIALQIAIKALDLKGEIITTPFSYVATTTSILWENCQPVFVDIEDKTFCIDADKIEKSITKKTSAILATHCYGFPCDVLKIQAISKKHKLKIIYDGAHAFGVKINGKSIFEYGDISTLSFHATKLFHTVEGGAVICNNSEIDKKIALLKSFGHLGDEHFIAGINGKNSEFHAAMGLCNLPRVKDFVKKRKDIFALYKKQLSGFPIKYPVIPENIEYNYAYFPIIFETEKQLLKIKNKLSENNINTRRYFFPSLNKLNYVKGNKCPVSEDISTRVLCLPMYQELTKMDVKIIVKVMKMIDLQGF